MIGLFSELYWRRGRRLMIKSVMGSTPFLHKFVVKIVLLFKENKQQKEAGMYMAHTYV